MYRHSADSIQWKKFDDEFLKFGKKSRNIRLGLATNGMNLLGNMSTNHSSWPVLLVIYNLPPGLCMKQKYIMFSMMISGPLIEDLKLMWDHGVEVFDIFANETFKMHVMLFCTIDNFSTYGNLLGYNVKGHKACPICEEDISSP